MSGPLFSIVIPTRDRPDTLDICLNVLSRIDYRDIEFVIQDNCSGPDTFRVVERYAAKDKRIVYHRSDRRLSMRQNFEAGLRQAHGQYMGIIGDDDGFFGSSLPAIEKIVETHEVDIIGWPIALYFWPSLTENNEGFIRMASRAFYGQQTFKAGDTFVKEMLTGQLPRIRDRYRIYHGFISRQVYERALKVHGEMFGYPLPDTYTNCMVPFFAKKMCCLPRPASLPGFSGHSSGTAWSQSAPVSDTLSKSKVAWRQEDQSDILSPPGWASDIKSERYHELQSLKIILKSHPQWALLLNEDAFIAGMVEEIQEQVGMLRGFRQAWENGEGDRPVIEQVVTRFSDLKTLPDDRIVFRYKSPKKELCVKAVSSNLPDTVDGALQTIERVIGTNYTSSASALMPLKRLAMQRRIRRLNNQNALGRSERAPRPKVTVDYFADELGVRSKIIPFQEDERFKAAWAYTAEKNDKAWPGGTPDVRWRAHTACWAAEQALTVEGDFVECGVYMGLLSLTVCGVIDFDKTGRAFWLFDTFAGIPQRQGSTLAAKTNEIYTCGLKEAQDAFSRFRSARLVAGALPETLNVLPPDRMIAYLSVDLNDAGYEMQVMDRLWPRLSAGGVVLIDDYGWTFNREQHRVWNRFASENGVSILSLPTGQGLIVKPQS